MKLAFQNENKFPSRGSFNGGDVASIKASNFHALSDPFRGFAALTLEEGHLLQFFY